MTRNTRSLSRNKPLYQRLGNDHALKAKLLDAIRCVAGRRAAAPKRAHRRRG
jgi:hypothetical protein